MRGRGLGRRRGRAVPADRAPDRPGRVLHRRHRRRARRCTRRPTATSGPWARRSRARERTTTMELPAQPARCDIHAFGSATGGTTFFVNVTIDGAAGADPARDEPRGHRRGVLLRRRGVRLLMGGFPWTARTRRLLFVVVMLVLLTFPLVIALVTRAQHRALRGRRDGHGHPDHDDGDAYLVAFRLPEEVDPDQVSYSAEVDRATYEKAAASKEIGVRVLEDRPGGPPGRRRDPQQGAVRHGGRRRRPRAGGGAVVGPRRPPPPDRADPRQQPPRAGRSRRGRLARASARRRATRPSARCCRPTTPRSCSTSASARWSSPWPGTRNPVPVGPRPGTDSACPRGAERARARTPGPTLDRDSQRPPDRDRAPLLARNRRTGTGWRHVGHRLVVLDHHAAAHRPGPRRGRAGGHGDRARRAGS